MAGVTSKTQSGGSGLSQPKEIVERGLILSVASGEQSTPASFEILIRSKTFGQAATLRTLLVYLWEHRQEPVSEYAIAVEALGRTENFDPKFDATVRVQVARLRQRLQRYYEVEGQDCAERFVIPLGSHELRVEKVQHPVCPPTPPNVEIGSRLSPVTRTLGLLCVVLFVISAGL